ncbi:hypothetical protein [Clostridium sp. KNHs214]|uniref:hypothetical protein n=1 Tax=Clostridium sp. KNHs214 TaxID=1540257 RepID=UPI0005559E02|nr:hypothetical protein [Clostridium sp. KNHs214]
MVNKIKSYFDDFTFHSRVMPVLVVSIPIILLWILKGIQTDTWVTNTIYTLVIIAFISFAAMAARERGKKFQNRMYDKLGAMPTTIVLRYSDKTYDEITKTRYHKKLNKSVEGVCLPIEPKDETRESDKYYESAMNWLRNYANSNRDKEPRVYQELKKYNYWRNLYGLKFFAIILYSLVGIREYFINDSFNWKELITKPYPQYMAFIFMIFSILMFVIFVNKSTVEKNSFDYAKSLIEVCERI